MLKLFYSNRQEILLEKLNSFLRQKESAGHFSFGKKKILTQNVGMQRWLSFELSKRNGIFINVDFDFPLRFLWNLFREVCHFEQESLVASQKQFTHLQIFEILNEKKSASKVLQQYLKSDVLSDNDLKLWALAGTLASLFDEYELFRTTELPQKLDNHNNDDWQFDILKQLVQQNSDKKFRFQSQIELIEALRNGGLTFDFNEIHIYGIPTFPEAGLRSLLLLAKQNDLQVCLYQLKATEKESENPHELIRKLAQEGEEQTFLIQNIIKDEQIPFEVDETYYRINAENQLEAYQQGILCGTSMVTQHADESLQIHAHYSVQREVEYLRDELILQFEKHPDLNPGDILIMSPDIDRYAAHIDYYFNESVQGAALPYSIADSQFSALSDQILAVNAGLDLLQSRFKRSDFLLFLRLNAVREKLQLSEQALSMIEKWAETYLLLNGWEEEVPYPVWGDFSAERVGDRLFKALFFHADTSQLRKEVLISESIATLDEWETWAKLDFVLQTLMKWKKNFAQAKPISEWMTFLQQFTELFLYEDERKRFSQKLASVSELVLLAASQTPVSASVFKHFFQLYFGESSAGSGFLEGKITCSAMVPLRSLPFKVIYLLGLNEGEFPGERFRPSFDWIGMKPKEADRNRKKDDQYLFLESILSARKKLYISYLGKSQTDDSVLPMSPLIQQFMESVLSITGHQIEVQNHSLHSHHKQEFLNSGAYNKRVLAILNQKNQKKEEKKQTELRLSQLLEKTDWNLNEWVVFLVNTLEFALKNEFNASVYKVQDSKTDIEPFTVSGLGGWKANDALIEHLMENDSAEIQSVYSLFREKGFVAVGSDTFHSFEKRFQNVESVIKQVRQEFWQTGVPEAQFFEYAVNGFNLSGFLHYNGADDFVKIQAGDFKIKHQVKAVLEGLFLAQIQQRDVCVHLMNLQKKLQYHCPPNHPFLSFAVEFTQKLIEDLKPFDLEKSKEIADLQIQGRLWQTDISETKNEYGESSDQKFEMALKLFSKQTDFEKISVWLDVANAFYDNFNQVLDDLKEGKNGKA